MNRIYDARSIVDDAILCWLYLLCGFNNNINGFLRTVLSSINIPSAKTRTHPNHHKPYVEIWGYKIGRIYDDVPLIRDAILFYLCSLCGLKTIFSDRC